MRISLWSYETLDVFASALQEQFGPDLQIDRESPSVCDQTSQASEVDFSLVPALSVLKNPKNYRIIPGVGLASLGGFPHARLRLNSALDHLGVVAADDGDEQAADLAHIVISEHYGQKAELVGLNTPKENGEGPDAVVVCPERSEFLPADRGTLDLGSEWFELTAKPMIWGLLVSTSERLPTGAWEKLTSATLPVGSDEEAGEIVAYGFGEIYTRLDEFSLEGLETFADYLFWTHRIDEIPDLQFAIVPELV